MKSRRILACLAVILLVTSGLAHAQNGKRKTPDPAKYNLDAPDEKLKKMSIRAEMENSSSTNNSTFRIAKEKDAIVRVTATVSDQRTIGFQATFQSQYLRFTPVLTDDKGVPLPYTPAALEKIKELWERGKDANAMRRSSGPSVFISPNQENTIGALPLADWYGKLSPGRYKVAVKFGFGNDENEPKIESKIITLEIY